MSERPEFCLIIGAMKSGTTSLFELLAQHPEVSPCKEKEPSFFCHPDRVEEGIESYLGLWHWQPGQRVALEASTQYAKAPWYPGVPQRIADVEGHSFRFIYVLRDPLRRIESQVRHSLYEGWGKPLDDGVPQDAVDFSRYAMQLDQFMEHFPREAFLVVLLEEFKSDPERVLRRVCEFLEIDPDFAFADPDKTRNSGDFFSIPPALAAVARNPVAGRLVRAMPQGLKRWLREALGRLGRARKAADDPLGRWRLDRREQAEIWAVLDDDLVRLREVYGVDFDRWWSRPSNGAAEPGVPGSSV